MCGIVGYVGKRNAIDVLLTGLKNLEYRGYDSAGIAIKNNNGVVVTKKEGKIKNLEEILDKNSISNLGIGHTRWATHGGATQINAHPHKVGNVTIVHNGIIENYEKLKKDLIDDGYSFKSNTDTEVASALIDFIYKNEKDKFKTLRKVSEILTGSYALGIIFDDDNDNIYAMRKDSPLIIGLGENENFIASDVPAILEFTNKYILLEKDEYAVINQNEITIYNKNKEKLEKEILTYEGSIEHSMKNGYEHFMLKEINDEPEVFKNMFNQFNSNNIDELIKAMPDLSHYDSINIVGCGSAYHAGLVGKSLIEKYAGIPVNVYIASEYRYSENYNSNKSLTILISQSGETADTLAALRKDKENGIDTLGIINTVSSSIARESKMVLYIKAGCEISVATTKAYSAQVLMLELIALTLGVKNKTIDKDFANDIIKSIKKLPNEINKIIKTNEKNKEIAKKVYKSHSVFFIGRKIDYALCMEGSLKLKEISYIHSESYAAGELKHGTISLIEEGTFVFSVVTDPSIEEKTISNIKEVKARGANVVFITTDEIEKKYNSSDFYDSIIVIPNINEFINPLLIAVNLQLTAYYVAKEKGLEIDKPRNLAKSVTVE